MSAPSGFNEHASLLPDPGTNARPIHVMNGGGSSSDSNSNENDEILKKYGMGKDGPIEDRIPPETRVEFIKQIKSGVCSANTGNSVILKKDCWAVLEVVRELINVGIQKANGGKDIIVPSLETSMSEFKNVLESQALVPTPVPTLAPVSTPAPVPTPTLSTQTNAVSELQNALNTFKIDVNDYNKLNSADKKKLIHKTYKKLALEKHPNKGGITDDFQKLQDAYSILKNSIVDNINQNKKPNTRRKNKLSLKQPPPEIINNYFKKNNNSKAKLEEPISIIEDYVKEPNNSEAKLEEPISIIEDYVKEPNNNSEAKLEESITPSTNKATEEAKSIINNYLNPKPNIKIENIQNIPFEQLETNATKTSAQNLLNNATLNSMNDSIIKALRQSIVDSKKRLIEINSLLGSTTNDNKLKELNEEKNVIENLVQNWESILNLKAKHNTMSKKGGKTRRRLTRKKSKRSISKKRSKY
jgi:hypothetical protein